jgi:hypothetical protein
MFVKPITDGQKMLSLTQREEATTPTRQEVRDAYRDGELYKAKPRLAND